MKNKYLFLFILLINKQSYTLNFNIFSRSNGKIQEEIKNQELDFKNGKIELKTFNGNIEIQTWDKPKLVLIATKDGKDNPNIQIDIRKIIRQKNEIIQIFTKNGSNNPKVNVNYNIIMPSTTNLKVSLNNGHFKAKDLKGTLVLKLNKGDVDIKDTINSLYSKINSNGNINVSYKDIPQNTKIILITSNGNIQLNLNKEINAEIQAKTLNGYIISDHYITLKPKTIKINNKSIEEFKKNIYGTIGKNYSKIEVSTNKGYIKILEL